nr:hypothetical protein [Tanacetum cinerariifolium]
MGTHDDEAESSRSKRSKTHETVEEVLLPQVHHEFLLLEFYSREAKSRYNTRFANLLFRHIYSPCVMNWDMLNRMGRTEIHQEAIERIEYRKSYHWDRYQGAFEYMAEVYSVPM